MDQIEYLESERKKLWAKLAELQEQIEKRSADYEQDARQSSKKSSEYRNKCESARDEIRVLADEIQRIADGIKQSNVDGLISEIKTAHESFIPRTQAVAAKLQELETLFSSYATYAEKLKKLNDLSEAADESSSKIETTVKQLLLRKNEIDQLYYEIFGYSSTDPKSGDITVVTGQKEQLEHTYAELKSGFEKFSREKTEEFGRAFDGWNTQFNATHNKIESLLPNALTAGLSAAYSIKKSDEIADHKRLEKLFGRAVIALVAVSLIPFSVGVYQLFHEKTLEDVILNMPRLVLAILPLYVPVLWFAYSFNRKTNLSKRLIEEYTHKEVLSKTFEGLSTQIQNIKDSEISDDLKTRLLYNIMEVSSENPGKLISNYNKSDHPLMDVLDKSVKLNNSIEYLSKVPGMSKLVDILEKRSSELLDKETKKAMDGIDSAVASRVPKSAE